MAESKFDPRDLYRKPVEDKTPIADFLEGNATSASSAKTSSEKSSSEDDKEKTPAKRSTPAKAGTAKRDQGAKTSSDEQTATGSPIAYNGQGETSNTKEN